MLHEGPLLRYHQAVPSMSEPRIPKWSSMTDLDIIAWHIEPDVVVDNMIQDSPLYFCQSKQHFSTAAVTDFFSGYYFKRHKVIIERLIEENQHQLCTRVFGAIYVL